MKIFLVSLSFLLFFSLVLANRNNIVARVNGLTFQVLNVQTSSSWQDYCHLYSQSSTSITTMLTVACRSLGYEGFNGYNRLSYSPAISTTYPQYNIICDGYESSLSECDIQYFSSYTSCRYYYTVNCLPCSNGSSRLTGGLVPHHGHVEVCLDGQWSRVCYVGWHTRDAVVLCRQLNFPYSQLNSEIRSTYELNNVGFIPSTRGFNCFGNESRLIDCAFLTYSSCLTNSGSRSYNSPIVQCKGEQESRCNAGSVRLYGGPDNYEGNLQMCMNETWTNVITYAWDYWDAEVACQQLRLFQYGNTKVTWRFVSSGVASQPRSHLGFNCSRSHRRLQDCPYFVTYYDYSTVYLHCQPLSLQSVSCVNGQLRLMGGPSSNEGRVEICWDGIWGSICQNSWGSVETTIACEQLGYQSENSTTLSPIYGDGDIPIIFSNFYCLREESLLQCQRANEYIGYHTCSGTSYIAATIRCDASKCNHGDVRLYGGYVSLEGAPQVCINGQWATMCQIYWNFTDSTTFCKQLHSTTNIRAIQNTAGNLRQYPVSRNTIGSVACSSVSSVPFFTRDCSYVVNNATCSRIYVGCYEYTDCVNGSVRLVRASSANDGVVEICQDGVWGSITSANWDHREASVVCRQLGMPWERALGSTDTRKSSFFRHAANCVGTENSIWDCSFSFSLSIATSTTSNTILRYYNWYSAAAVICRGYNNTTSSSCETGDVRLLNPTQTSNTMQGTVQICADGAWADVCYSSAWSERHANLACTKLLGYSPKFYWSYRSEDNVNQDNLLSSVYCSSSAQNFSSCSLSYNDRTCNKNVLVGISCQDLSYSVTINSLQKKERFQIGEQVHVLCDLSPDFIYPGTSVQLRFRWSINGQFVSYQQNLSINIEFDYTKSNVLYCEVSANNLIIGRGHFILNIEGIIENSIPNSFDIRNGSVYLNALANGTLLNGIMSELVWYYNNHPVAKNSNLTFIEETASLVTTAYGSTGYKARFEGFLTIPHDKSCENSLLNELDNYPAFSPAHFPKGVSNNEPKLSLTTNFESSTHVQYTSNERVSITVKVDLSREETLYFTRSYAIGIFNNRNDRFYYDSLGYDEVFWTHTVELTEGQSTDAGMYEVFLYSTYSSEFRSNCSSYYNLIRRSPFYIYGIIVEKKSLQLSYYENKRHAFTSTKYQFFSSESTVLECQGNIDIPEFSKIFIRKENLSLNSSQLNHVELLVNVEDLRYPYGVYYCVMNAEGIEFTKSVHLKNKVNIEVQLKFKAAMEKCEEKKEFIDLMVGDMSNLIKEMCDCDISELDFKNTTIHCPSDINMNGIFNSTLVYSSRSGDQSASTVAEMLFTEASLSFSTLALRGDILIEEVSFYDGNGILSTVADNSQDNGLSLELTVVVALASFAAGILICIGLVGVLYCVRHKKLTKHQVPHSELPISVNAIGAKYVPYSSKTEAIDNMELPMYDRPHPINIPQSSNTSKYIEQPMYEPIQAAHEDISMSPNVVYGRATLSKI